MLQIVYINEEEEDSASKYVHRASQVNNMKIKIFLLLCGLFALAMGQPTDRSISPPCGCPPDKPICASNYKTYNGICEMNCEPNRLLLHKLHDGPCRPGEGS